VASSVIECHFVVISVVYSILTLSDVDQKIVWMLISSISLELLGVETVIVPGFVNNNLSLIETHFSVLGDPLFLYHIA